MLKKINQIINFDKEFIVIDLEANGVFEHPKVLQIGAIKVFNNKIIEKFNIDIKCTEPLNFFLQLLLNKKPNYFFKKVPVFKAWNNFMKFVGKCDQIVHFGNYDPIVLNSLSKKFNTNNLKLIDFQSLYLNPIISSDPDAVCISIDNVKNSLNIKFDLKHNAYDDAFLLYKIIESFKKNENRSIDLLMQGYCFPRKKTLRGIPSNITQVIDFNINMINKILFINYMKTNDEFQVEFYYIYNNKIEKNKNFKIRYDLIKEKKYFYKTIYFIYEFIENLNFNEVCLMCNTDFIIKQLQIQYCSINNKYPLFIWIPYSWFNLKYDLSNLNFDQILFKIQQNLNDFLNKNLINKK